MISQDSLGWLLTLRQKICSQCTDPCLDCAHEYLLRSRLKSSSSHWCKDVCTAERCIWCCGLLDKPCLSTSYFWSTSLVWQGRACFIQLFFVLVHDCGAAWAQGRMSGICADLFAVDPAALTFLTRCSSDLDFEIFYCLAGKSCLRRTLSIF